MRSAKIGAEGSLLEIAYENIMIVIGGGQDFSAKCQNFSLLSKKTILIFMDIGTNFLVKIFKKTFLRQPFICIFRAKRLCSKKVKNLDLRGDLVAFFCCFVLVKNTKAFFCVIFMFLPLP